MCVCECVVCVCVCVHVCVCVRVCARAHTCTLEDRGHFSVQLLLLLRDEFDVPARQVKPLTLEKSRQLTTERKTPEVEER